MDALHAEGGRAAFSAIVTVAEDRDVS